jgi:2-methylisocitrate lyase-like PEP mutase family enzyme
VGNPARTAQATFVARKGSFMNRVQMQQHLQAGNVMPFIGVYDVFSASLAARHYQGLFVSGFGFAASYYGLPDIGFIAWPDILSFVQRLRSILPGHQLLVDIDDGYCDTEIACHVVSALESLGAFGVILEDQKRPRKCGHFEGKQILEVDEYLVKLRRVLATGRDLFVVARTDASDLADIRMRVRAFAEAGADAILVDGLRDLRILADLKTDAARPIVFNQIAGGKSPPCTLSQLRDYGVSIVIYSTPCLFAAQEAIDLSMRQLRDTDGLLPPPGDAGVGVKACTALLTTNLERKSALGVNPPHSARFMTNGVPSAGM